MARANRGSTRSPYRLEAPSPPAGMLLLGSCAALALAGGAAAKGSGPSALEAHGRTAWIGTGSGHIWRIDGRDVRRLPWRAPGRYVHALRLGFGSLWIVDGTRLVRANPETGRARWSRRGRFYDVALGAGSVWVDAGDGRVHQFSPVSRRYVATTRVPGAVVSLYDGGSGPWVLGTPSGRIFSAAGKRVLYRIDPRSARAIPVRRLYCSVLAAEGAGLLWLADLCTNRVYGIDPRSGRVRTRTLRLPHMPAALTFAGGALWIVTHGCGVRRIDPVRVRVVATLCVPRYLSASGTTRLWLASWAGYVTEVDPATNRPSNRIRISPTRG
jgi:hypothetical protein